MPDTPAKPLRFGRDIKGNAGAAKNKRHLRLRPAKCAGAVKNMRHLRLRYARSSKQLGAFLNNNKSAILLTTHLKTLIYQIVKGLGEEG